MSRVYKKREVSKPTGYAMRKPTELTLEQQKLTDGYQKHFNLRLINLSLDQLMMLAESLAAMSMVGKAEATNLFLTLKAKAPTLMLKNQMDAIQAKYEFGGNVL
jgi:ABC-type uncharacterized transport system ATPase subunit